MSIEPIIKVRDVANPRLQVPDLDAMEAFLVEFGMVRSERTRDTLYMRGCGPANHLHVVHRGEPAFLGFAFEVRTRADIERLASSEGFTPVEAIDAPGGGWRTTTRDPHGALVEVVYGIATLDLIGSAAPRPLNMGSKFERIDRPQRIEQGPSRIKRFGHLAINVADLNSVVDWYHARFGLIVSDRINVAPEMPVAVFTRCDRGDEPSDHHSILFASHLGSGGVSGLNHVSWEVRDIDDVHAGNAYLAAKGRRHEWGIGRHLLGSQVFDYWRDPWGHIHEHRSDGDQFDASVPAGDHTPAVGLASQWGPNPPSTFGRTIPPAAA